MDRIINILALVTLIEMMVFIGLSTSLADFLNIIKNWKLVAQAILANYILVPVVTVGLLLLFHAQPLVSIGFLILAVCPAGPYGAPYTAIARGNVGAAAGMMLILTGLSPLLSPMLLNVLAPVVATNQHVTIDLVKMIVMLLFGQVIPLVAGLTLHQYRPQLATRMIRPAAQLSKLLNVAILILLFYNQFQSLLQIRLIGLIGMLILLSASIAIGWIAGGPDRAGRKAMALTTAVRNNGVGMVIATASFSGTPAVAATIIYGIVVLLGTLVLALVWSWQRPAKGAGEIVTKA